MASLGQLPSGRWRVIYYHQGKRASRTFDTIDQARAWVTVWEGDKAKGHRYDPAAPRTLFRDYAEAWYQLRPTGPNHGAARSKERWALDRHLVPAFGGYELGAIHRSHVQAWVNQSALAPATVRALHTILAAILRTAAADGFLPAGTPLGRGLVRLPQLDTEPSWTILGYDELGHLLDVCYERHPAAYPPVRLLADTGMRQGEAFALRRVDYSPLGQWVDVVTALKRVNGAYVEGTRTKTGRRRRIALPMTSAQALNAQLAAHTFDLIFPNRRGGIRDLAAWRRRVWQPLVDDAGFPNLKPHDLRHTHATHLLDSGVEPGVVAERLGHASTKQTLDTYGHVLPGRQQAALQLLSRNRKG